jgi:light-regulated signal transduction histidine kinase (bacteriophytochrome)
MAVSPTSDKSMSLDIGVRGLRESCEDEPIRIPGRLQRHGFLLLLDDANEHVVAASQNTEEFLEVPLGWSLARM